MKPVAELKKELVFNREMNELVDILKKVAVTQFQAVFSRWKKLGAEQGFTNLIAPFWAMLDLKSIRHPFFTNPSTNVLCVIITSDTGFLGGLNTIVIETALRQRQEKETIKYLVVGGKGHDYMEGKITTSPRDATVLDDEAQEGERIQQGDLNFLPGISDEIHLAEAQRLGNHIFRLCLKERLGKLLVIYPKFISFAQQEVEIFNLSGYLKVVQPAAQPPSTQGLIKTSVTYEPFLDKVTDYLLRLSLTHKLYELFWHSKLSEFAARMTHLESSLQELSEMKKQLTLQFFKSKHEITDRTIRDIFGGLLTSKRKFKKDLVTKHSYA